MIIVLLLYYTKDSINCKGESDGPSYRKSLHDMQVRVLYRYRVAKRPESKFCKKGFFSDPTSIYSSIDFGKLNVSCGSYWSFRVFNSGY